MPGSSTQTWAQLAARKEFERAVEVSVKAREDILRRLLQLTAMEPRRSNAQKFVHTTTDVLLANVDAQLPGKDKISPNCVAFYSHCAPTTRSPHERAAPFAGVLSVQENSPNAPAYWWHGKHVPDLPAGEPWEMQGTEHAMPVFGPSLKFSKKMVAGMEAAGYPAEGFGFVKLMPIT